MKKWQTWDRLILLFGEGFFRGSRYLIVLLITALLGFEGYATYAQFESAYVLLTQLMMFGYSQMLIKDKNVSYEMILPSKLLLNLGFSVVCVVIFFIFSVPHFYSFIIFLAILKSSYDLYIYQFIRSGSFLKNRVFQIAGMLPVFIVIGLGFFYEVSEEFFFYALVIFLLPFLIFTSIGIQYRIEKKFFYSSLLLFFCQLLFYIVMQIDKITIRAILDAHIAGIYSNTYVLSSIPLMLFLTERNIMISKSESVAKKSDIPVVLIFLVNFTCITLFRFDEERGDVVIYVQMLVVNLLNNLLLGYYMLREVVFIRHFNLYLAVVLAVSVGMLLVIQVFAGNSFGVKAYFYGNLFVYLFMLQMTRKQHY